MLPDKTIKLSFSILGIGATLLKNVQKDDTITSLWERIKREETINTYEKFIKGLVLLNALGAVELDGQIIKKVTS